MNTCQQCARFNGEWRCPVSDPAGRQTYSLGNDKQRVYQEACGNFKACADDAQADGMQPMEHKTITAWATNFGSFDEQLSQLFSDGWQPLNFAVCPAPNGQNHDILFTQTLIR